MEVKEKTKEVNQLEHMYLTSQKEIVVLKNQLTLKEKKIEHDKNRKGKRKNTGKRKNKRTGNSF